MLSRTDPKSWQMYQKKYYLYFFNVTASGGLYSYIYIDRVWLKYDLVENISSNNTLHIFTPFIISLYCRYIEINTTEKTVSTGLFYWGN